MKKVAIIIIHYGLLQTTRECIRSLQRYETYPFHIFLINNDQKRMLTKKDFAARRITVMNNNQNLGFAKAANKGIQEALKQKFPYVFLLNNDTEIASSMLKDLVHVLENPHIGIAGPVLSFKRNNRRIYDLGGSIHPLFGRTSHNEVEKVTFKDIRLVEYLSAAAMLVRANVFKKIGSLDERFFMYYEDVDFCIRARKAGFTIASNPKVIMFHVIGHSAQRLSPFWAYHQIKSAIIFGKKYYNTFPRNIFHSIFIFLQVSIFFLKNPLAGVGGMQALFNKQ